MFAECDDRISTCPRREHTFHRQPNLRKARYRPISKETQLATKLCTDGFTEDWARQRSAVNAENRTTEFTGPISVRNTSEMSPTGCNCALRVTTITTKTMAALG